MKTTVTINSFEIKDNNEGWFNGPKGEFRFNIHIKKENSNEDYFKLTKITDLPSPSDYYSWEEGNHNVNHDILLDKISLKKGDTITVSVSGTEIDDTTDPDLLGRVEYQHKITPGQNDNHSMGNENFTVNYTVSSS